MQKLSLLSFHSLPSDATITHVRIYWRALGSYGTYGESLIVTHDTLYEGSLVSLGSTYQTYYTHYDTNPYTGEPWTLDEINNLQAGVKARSGSSTCGYMAPRCTQIYTEIDYNSCTVECIATKFISCLIDTPQYDVYCLVICAMGALACGPAYPACVAGCFAGCGVIGDAITIGCLIYALVDCCLL